MSDEPPTCTLCGQTENFYCRDSSTGDLRPMCVEKCGEHASFDGRCRDCGIEHQLARMQCSVCTQMRYRERDGSRAADIAVGIGEALWGERCACPEPKPPSVAEAKEKSCPTEP